MPTRYGPARAAAWLFLFVVVVLLPRSAIAQGGEVARPAGEPAPADARAANGAALARAKSLAEEHVRAGRFAEAATAAEEASHLSEQLNGPDSIETAVARHNLGFIQRRAGRAKEARESLEKALAAYERLLPAANPDVRNVVGELGAIYISEGRGGDVAGIYARLVERAEREGAGQHILVAQMLASRGFVLRLIGRPGESEAAFAQSLGIFEALGNIAGSDYRQTLTALLDKLDQTKRLGEAEVKANAALRALAATGTRGVSNAMAIHDWLSRATLEAGRAADAKVQAEEALRLLSGAAADPGRNDKVLQVGALNNLARASRALSDHATAEDAYKRAIALLEEIGDVANTGIVTDNLAVLYLELGKLDEAERTNKRALALLEKALGRTHRSVGRAAGNLGVLLSESGRFKEAEPLLRRALAISEAQQEKDLVQIGIIEDNLAGVMRQSGKTDEAGEFLARAVQHFEQALPARHPRIATARNNLGRYLLDLRRFDEAAAVLGEALELAEGIYGKENVSTAIPAANLAEAFTGLRRYDEARRLLTRALAVLETVYGPRHTNLLPTLNAFGRLEIADGKPAGAKAMFERAVAVVLAERARSGMRIGGSSPSENRRALLGLIEAIWLDGGGAAPDKARALEIAQHDSMTPAAVALAALGARAGAGNAALGALTRERQDLAAEWVDADKRLSGLLAETSRDAGEEATTRARLAAIDVRIGELDAELAKRFPQFQELARPAPIAINELRHLMSPREVAIQFTVAGDATYVFAVSRSDFRWFRAAVDQRELGRVVRRLRCGLDAAEWSGDGQNRCASQLGIDPETGLAAGEPLPFDLTSAHRLYGLLLEPIADMIAGKDLLVVASGALTSLPLHTLLAEAPPPDTLGTTLADGRLITTAGTSLQDITWLGKRHAVTALPSLSSLPPLRKLSSASAGRLPYIGIGNPLLTGPAGDDRRAFEVPACNIDPTAIRERQRLAGGVSSQPVSRKVLRMSIAPQAQRSSSSNMSLLRQQYPLPETADELCRVAGYARATAGAVVTGAEATETRVKELSAEGRLAQARVVHFATHGLLAGETAMFLAGKAEPSLLLSPPAEASESDDGLLTASEVASLRLDADWVVLSACNTASGEEVGAEALSGLARAFFYAGARSLLVSHWAVDSDATVELVTTAFDAMARDPGLGQAAALSKAMTGMMSSNGRAAHPASWAPFVVVGGNAPRYAAARKGLSGQGRRTPARSPTADADDWRKKVLQPQ